MIQRENGKTLCNGHDLPSLWWSLNFNTCYFFLLFHVSFWVSLCGYHGHVLNMLVNWEVMIIYWRSASFCCSSMDPTKAVRVPWPCGLPRSFKVRYLSRWPDRSALKVICEVGWSLTLLPVPHLTHCSRYNSSCMQNMTHQCSLLLDFRTASSCHI